VAIDASASEGNPWPESTSGNLAPKVRRNHNAANRDDGANDLPICIPRSSTEAGSQQALGRRGGNGGRICK
jgi:hypothetical protein